MSNLKTVVGGDFAGEKMYFRETFPHVLITASTYLRCLYFFSDKFFMILLETHKCIGSISDSPLENFALFMHFSQ